MTVPSSGIHAQRPFDNWPNAAIQQRAGTWIKFIDDVQALSEAKSRNSSLKTLLRHFDGGWQAFDFATHTDRRAHIRRFLESFVDVTFMEHAANVNAIEGWNEYNASSHNATEVAKRVEIVRAFCQEWADMKARHSQLSHIRLVCGNVAIGNDFPLESARIIQQYNQQDDYGPIVGYHPYVPYRHPSRTSLISLNALDRPIAYNGITACMRAGEVYHLDVKYGSPDILRALGAVAPEIVIAGVLQDEWPHLSGRWTEMDRRFRAAGITVEWLGTEGGPIGYFDWGGLGPNDGWRHPDVCAGDMNLYLQVLDYWTTRAMQWNASNGQRMLGQVLYNSGGTSEWQHFETNTTQHISIAQLMRTYVEPPPTPVPEPDPPTPARVINYVTNLPDNTSSPYYPYDTRPLSAITKIIVHHSVGQTTNPPESINIGHHNRNWPRIGYHFYINVDASGNARIYKTNYLTTHSYHAGTVNRESIGICLAGDFTSVHPSTNQLEAARYLIDWINDTLGNKQLLKHRDVMATACPGDSWEQWWSQLTEEPMPIPDPDPRIYGKKAHLVRKDAAPELLEAIHAVAIPNGESVFYSADDWAQPSGNTDKVQVTSKQLVTWNIDEFLGLPNAEAIHVIENWARYYYPEPEPTFVHRRIGALFVADRWSSPIGTPAERNSRQIWPGAWNDANPFANRYLLSGRYYYHPGSDLNLNTPMFDMDRNKPVYAAASGKVIYAGVPSTAWQGVVIIRHQLSSGAFVYSRSAHLQPDEMTVITGQWVKRGKIIGLTGRNITDTGPGPYHLHFEIAKTDILVGRPDFWPNAEDRAVVIANWHDPKVWLQANV